MSLDGTFYGDGTVVRVEGLSKLSRELRKSGVDVQRMNEIMHAIGQAVVSSANVPTKTGRLKSTLRAGKGRTKAVVRMGGARAPYAGVIEYGWRARGITGSMAVNRARDSRKQESQRMIRAGVDKILKNNNLL
ncbi:hypothetical protein ACR5KS_03625 [Leucobacter sp. W1153]|uniref:hypothetical protein n=1 Tax=Leucobacter sp. W1153 TaxID=3439064 RepID=UPI003F2E1289